MPIKDPIKRSEYNKKYQKEHYKLNREKYLEKAVKHNKEYRKRNSRFVQEYKNGKPCAKCGGFFSSKVLEFHHVDASQKIDNIASMVVKSYSIAAIRSEIEKCLLLCSNCHRSITYEE